MELLHLYPAKDCRLYQYNDNISLILLGEVDNIGHSMPLDPDNHKTADYIMEKVRRTFRLVISSCD